MSKNKPEFNNSSNFETSPIMTQTTSKAQQELYSKPEELSETEHSSLPTDSNYQKSSRISQEATSSNKIQDSEETNNSKTNDLKRWLIKL